MVKVRFSSNRFWSTFFHHFCSTFCRTSLQCRSASRQRRRRCCPRRRRWRTTWKRRRWDDSRCNDTSCRRECARWLRRSTWASSAAGWNARSHWYCIIYHTDSSPTVHSLRYVTHYLSVYFKSAVSTCTFAWPFQGCRIHIEFHGSLQASSGRHGDRISCYQFPPQSWDPTHRSLRLGSGTEKFKTFLKWITWVTSCFKPYVTSCYIIQMVIYLWVHLPSSLRHICTKWWILASVNFYHHIHWLSKPGNNIWLWKSI